MATDSPGRNLRYELADDEGLATIPINVLFSKEDFGPSKDLLRAHLPERDRVTETSFGLTQTSIFICQRIRAMHEGSVSLQERKPFQ